MTTHAIDQTTRAPVCGSYIYVGDQKDLGVTCKACLRDAEVVQVIGAHVNIGPEHMPLGLDEHLDHLRRLASRGQRDES